KAALRLMRKLLKSQGVTPRVMVTDKLRSYAAAQSRPGCHLFHLHRKHLTATDHRQLRTQAVTIWREIALSIDA
ncbi:IS6 family transposase, partial [Rhizobium leguminosarum]|nr:IS6 family transposase [Rhizobium leguminosarum]NEI25242.1 IS6 family transposase [Rhizobium ruizarguesonis]NEI32421.1 IS6 family transposase [Rhizobium ruizarguesonis]NEI67817.1 IS6 family transposase [Rhizobium leguminosarum]